MNGENPIPETSSPAEAIDPEIIAQASAALAELAKYSEQALAEWGRLFPGTCPGCGRHHAQINPYIKKGFCVNCMHLNSQADKRRSQILESRS